MANTTDPLARSVHGTNPQNMVEKIVRARIYSSRYWKEHCFGVTAETLVDKAMDLECFGGTYGGHRKPAKFLCLVLKCLQIQPDKEVIIEFIKNEDYKYVRVLGAFYLRLVGRALDIYQYLEPLLNDYRKIRERCLDGKYRITHVDEIVWDLLTKDIICDVALPHLAKRTTLEDQQLLPERISVLEDDLDDELLSEDGEQDKRPAEQATERGALKEADGFRDRDDRRDWEEEREPEREERERGRRGDEKGREREAERHRDRDRAREKYADDDGKSRGRDRKRSRSPPSPDRSRRRRD
eukprot:GGOE01006324.1.p1 GENE.GGOE01006324.1~~GGOE01006324.1.p1  ORF type:complete len:320 (+),score=86.47 GGOE01006324.1:72-962(+)